MKRRIIFRGKCAGTWRYGDHMTYANGECIKAWMGSISPEYDVEPDSVGQFTGAYDKNGKEIYEGDIIRFSNGGTIGDMYYVGYDCRKCSFKLYKKSGSKTKAVFDAWTAKNCYEVIGNLIDTPELLDVD